MWIQDPMKLWNLFEIVPVFFEHLSTILTASTEKHNKSAEKENTK